MLPEEEIEELAEDALRTSRMSTSEPPDPVRLAMKVVGRVVQLPRSGLPSGAFLAKIKGRLVICIRGEMAPRRFAWSLCHEVAEAILVTQKYPHGDVESVADRLAASLRAPRAFAQKACRARRQAWGQLALDFDTTESCAALRYGEVTGSPVALLTDAQVRFRGDWFDRPEEATIRALKRIPGLAKTRLRDDPRRTVFAPASLRVWA